MMTEEGKNYEGKDDGGELIKSKFHESFKKFCVCESQAVIVSENDGSIPNNDSDHGKNDNRSIRNNDVNVPQNNRNICNVNLDDVEIIHHDVNIQESACK